MSKQNNFMAFAAGLAAGAAVVFFSDQKNRETTQKMLNDAYDAASEFAQDPKGHLMAAGNKVEEVADDATDRVKRASTAAQKQLAKPAKSSSKKSA